MTGGSYEHGQDHFLYKKVLYANCQPYCQIALLHFAYTIFSLHTLFAYTIFFFYLHTLYSLCIYYILPYVHTWPYPYLVSGNSLKNTISSDLQLPSDYSAFFSWATFQTPSLPLSIKPFISWMHSLITLSNDPLFCSALSMYLL